MNGVARTRLVGGGILVATGLVWIGQGTALIKSSSFMTGDPFWAWTGPRGRRRRDRPDRLGDARPQPGS
jgi:hypothetical protein